MGITRPIVLSIAGLDPSAGAGLLADVKTLEQHGVYGIAVCTAITVQTEDDFLSIRWEKENDILYTLDYMLKHYDVSVVKIGIVENIQVLKMILKKIYFMNPDIKIVVDPVMRSSTGFDFSPVANGEVLWEILDMVFLITPNYIEIKSMFPLGEEKESARKMATHCNVLLKGGHNKHETGTDYLFMNTELVKLATHSQIVYPKHGSGCVLSAAIAANLALGEDVATACKNAKTYIEKFLSGSESLIGFHHV